MDNNFEDIRNINYLFMKANGDPFKWLLDYCDAIPQSVKAFIEDFRKITCVDAVPSSEAMYEIVSYFRGFCSITSSFVAFDLFRSDVNDLKYKYAELARYSDEEITEIKNKVREMQKFFEDRNRYTYYYKGSKRGEDHPMRIDEDGSERPVAIFDSPLECFVSSLVHTFNAMCSTVYYLSKSNDKDKYARYAALTQYVFRSFFDVYHHVGAKEFDTNIDVYIIPENHAFLYKYVANSFKYVDKHGKEHTYWYRDAMYTSKFMVDAFKTDEHLHKCDKFKIW